MANKHSTLAALFSDIADNIRAVTGRTEDIVADDFPKHISCLGNPVATQWSVKMDEMLTPTLSNVTAAITVKAMCYYDGYWYGIGTDSSGVAYKMYGTTTGDLTVSVFRASYNYPATGITCDGTYVWICTESGVHDNRVLLYQAIEDFRSTSTNYSYISSSVAHLTSICFAGDGYKLACGKHTSSNLGLMLLIDDISGRSVGISNFSECLIDCCVYAEKPVMVSAEGTIVQPYLFPTITSDISLRTKTYLSGAQKIRKMGDYLCVAVVKTDGTYLYFTSGDGWINKDFAGFKITDEILTVVGMAYAGGLYTLIGNNSNGETKVWQSADLKDHGIYGRTITLTSGYTARTMATDGTNICLLADNGSSVQKALATIS